MIKITFFCGVSFEKKLKKNFKSKTDFQYYIKLKFHRYSIFLKCSIFPKKTKTLKDSLDTYSNLKLVKTCDVVLKTLNYGVGISFKYFSKKFEECGVLKNDKFSNSRCIPKTLKL